MIQNAPPRRLIIEHHGRREVYDLFEDSLVIGRDPQADLQLDDHKVSRRHAELVRRDGILHISDLGSSNGTLVNGLPIFRATELAAGDKIDVGGNVVLWIEEAPAGATTAPVAAEPARRPTPSQASTSIEIDRASPAGDRISRSTHGSKAPLIAICIAVAALIGFLAFRPGDEDNGAGTPAPPPGPGVEQRANAGKHPDQEPTTGVGDTVTPSLPPASGQDLMRDFELAVVDGRFGAAWHLLERLDQDRGGDLKTRLEEAMGEIAATVKAEATQLQRSQGASAAAKFLRQRLEEFPSASAVHTELTAVLLGLPTRKPRPERSAVARADAPTTPANKPDEGKPATRPETPEVAAPVAADVMEKATAAVAAGDKCLHERRFKEAEARFLEATRLLEDVRGPSRSLRRALRGIRQVSAQLSFIDALVEGVGNEPGKLGRIPHVPGESGKVIRIDHEAVTFVGKSGPKRLAWRVLPRRAFEAILKKAQLDAGSMIDAAAWLRDYGAAEPAEELLARAYGKDPALKPRIEQALADARQIPLPEEGFALVDGQWFSPRELARKRLNEVVERSIKAIEGDDDNARGEAITVLMGLGDAARSSLYRALLMRKAILKERLSKGKATASLRGVGSLRTKLDEARAFALDLIFDTEKYPYPYRPPRASQAAFEQYRKHQPIVNERVAAVRKIWNDERSAAVPESVHGIVAEIRQLNEAIREADFGEPTEDPPSWLMHLPPPGQRLTVRNAATSSKDRERVDRSAGVVQRNEKDSDVATRGEIAQCRITNEYRLMMGRWAVRLYDPLVKASHGHCEDMSRLGFFSHMSPVPGKRSPYDRIVKAGMTPSGASENIAINSGPQGAHNAWIHSPGHHRNILGRSWRLMGPGNVGRHWCQNFSVSDRNVTDAYDK